MAACSCKRLKSLVVDSFVWRIDEVVPLLEKYCKLRGSNNAVSFLSCLREMLLALGKNVLIDMPAAE